jgi:hypothetical protein
MTVWQAALPLRQERPLASADSQCGPVIMMVRARDKPRPLSAGALFAVAVQPGRPRCGVFSLRNSEGVSSCRGFAAAAIMCSTSSASPASSVPAASCSGSRFTSPMKDIEASSPRFHARSRAARPADRILGGPVAIGSQRRDERLLPLRRQFCNGRSAKMIGPLGERIARLLSALGMSLPCSPNSGSRWPPRELLRGLHFSIFRASLHVPRAGSWRLEKCAVLSDARRVCRVAGSNQQTHVCYVPTM